VEWRWIEYAGEEGDHEGDPEKFKEKGLLGAMNVVENLLKRARSRWSLEKIAEEDWIRGGVNVEGCIRFLPEDDTDEAVDKIL
jgi:protein-serine/threonine kinase